MKQNQFLLLSLFLLIATLAQAQFDAERFGSIKIKKKNAVQLNKEAGEAAHYLLSTPAKPVGEPRKVAAYFLQEWMKKHPEMDFQLGDFYGKASMSNSSVHPIFLACMAEVKLENLGKELDDETLDLETAKKLVNYAKVKKNKVYANRYVKGMIKAEAKGELKEYISQ